AGVIGEKWTTPRWGEPCPCRYPGMAHLPGSTCRTGRCRWARSPPVVGDEVHDGHGFVAVGAEPAGADAPAEAPALGAVLGAQVACQARRALVDDRGPRRARRDRGRRRAVAPAPGRLTAGVRAEQAPPDRVDGAPADRAGGRRGVVTRRGVHAG